MMITGVQPYLVVVMQQVAQVIKTNKRLQVKYSVLSSRPVNHASW